MSANGFCGRVGVTPTGPEIIAVGAAPRMRLEPPPSVSDGGGWLRTSSQMIAASSASTTSEATTATTMMTGFETPLIDALFDGADVPLLGALEVVSVPDPGPDVGCGPGVPDVVGPPAAGLPV